LEENKKDFDLKAELKSLGMTLSDFAKEVHLAPNTVSRWSRGEIEIPKWVRPFIVNYRKAKKLDELANEAYIFNKL
jgi:transcriptional regulator with XRE-family HTH domain